jgi:hypothetical protein
MADIKPILLSILCAHTHTQARDIYWPYVCRPITTNMIERKGEKKKTNMEAVGAVISALGSRIETL